MSPELKHRKLLYIPISTLLRLPSKYQQRTTFQRIKKLGLSILDGAEIGSTDMETTWSSTVNRVKD